ncbi:MAG: GNAT family N-acetyltransferase, partial [candidate division Zixibacteria bacterium]|nr:GNAT family N-acetyltransferase [candidate division Zixibacteria bacterium]
MRYSVIKADIQKDRQRILSVWEKNFKDLPQERYPWFYENNPYGQALSWLVTDQKTNSVVGSTALFPRRMNLNGKRAKVGIAADFAVNQKHRSLSAAMKLQKAVISGCKENKVEFLYGFTNEQSEAVLLRAGYKKLGEVQRLAKLLRTKSKLKRYLPLPGTGLFSILLDFTLAIFSKERRYVESKDFKIELPKRFDERFD